MATAAPIRKASAGSAEGTAGGTLSADWGLGLGSDTSDATDDIVGRGLVEEVEPIESA